jgi:hypothetical protein
MSSNQIVGSVTLLDGGSSNLQGRGDLLVARNLKCAANIGKETAATTIVATGTLAAADLMKGIVPVDTSGGAVTLTFPSAANIVAAQSGTARVGDVIRCLIVCIAHATNATTIGAGTGNTLSGGNLVAARTSRLVHVRLTNVTSGTEAATIY